MAHDLKKVGVLAKDLRVQPPRSPREKLAGYVILGRSVDKWRALLLGINGEYNYQPCSLAAQFFTFTGITAEQLKELVAARWEGAAFNNVKTVQPASFGLTYWQNKDSLFWTAESHGKMEPATAVFVSYEMTADSQINFYYQLQFANQTIAIQESPRVLRLGDSVRFERVSQWILMIQYQSKLELCR